MKIKPALAAMAAVLALLSWLAPAAYAATPAALSYQATLRKNGALFNGTAAMEFRVTGADGTVYWTSGSTDVVVTAGLFRYALGSPNEAQFAAIPWGDITPYVLMKVDGGWLPREPLYSSAYSLHAYRAEGSSGTFTAHDGDIRISTTSGSRGMFFQDGSVQYRASGWTVSGSDAYTTSDGNAGIGIANPQARLDVQGGPAAQYTQIWRNEAGVIKASMTAAGMLYADGSLMRNMPTGADGLGTHTATQDLNINGYNVANVNSISGYGQALSVGSAVWMLNSRFGLGTNAPAAQLHISTSAGSSGDLLVISTGIAKVIRMNGAGAIYATKYYGDGSSLIGVTGGGGADNLGSHTLTQNLVTGAYWISSDGSAKGLNLDALGNAGIGQAAGSARLDVRGAVGNYIQLWRNASGLIQASMTVTGALYADGSQLRNLPAGGTATRALDMASFNINNVSTVTAGYLSSPGAGVVFTTNALVMGGRIGVNTAAPQEKLHVVGNILSSGLSGSGNRCVYADNTGVLRLSIDNCGLAGVNGDQLGLHVMSQNLNTSGNWISGDNNPAGLTVAVTGNVGVGMSGAATRLDVQSGADGYAQFWRNSGGTIVASMTSAGLFYADASMLRNLPVGADNLGTHTAAQALNMAGFQILNVSSVTVTGALGVGAARLSLNPNVGVSSETSSTLGAGVRISSNVYIVGFSSAARYYGDGSGLTGITGVADNLGNHAATQNLNIASFNIDNVSTMTAGYLSSPGAGVVFTTNALIMGGRLGIDTEAPQEKLHVNGFILSSPLSGAINRCAFIDPEGVIRAKGSDCGTAAGAADDLGSHVMIQNLNTSGNWISGDNNPAGLTIAVTGNVGVGKSGAATRLDVQSGADGYAQFWRNSGGTIVASMTSAGLLYADGAGLRGAASDNLGSHTASQNLDLASYNIINVSTITAGYLTSSGPGVVFSTNIIVAEGGLGINTYAPQESLHVNGNILSSNLSGPANRCVYVDMNGVLRAKLDDCGIASPTGDQLGLHIMTQNLVTGANWLSGDGGNDGIRIDASGNVSVGAATAGAKLDVRGSVGNYIQVWRNVAGTVQSSMSVTGVLYGDGSGLRNLPSTADNMGNHTMGQNLRTAFNWISADGDSEGIFVNAFGNVGLGTPMADWPATRLDVRAVNLDINSQIWRDSAGTIVASMTAAGVLYADASKLRNIHSSADGLGNHIATATLQMAGFDIKNAAAITASGQITSYSSVTVAGAVGLGAAKLRLGTGIEISSAPAAQQGGVYVSTNVYLAAGARYYGEGPGLTTLDASNVSAGTLNDARLSSNVPRLDADQSFAGVNTFASSLTVTSALGVGSARLRLNPGVEISSATAANSGGVYVSTHIYLADGARYYGDGSGLINAGDNLGNHLATAALNMGGNSIVNAASGTFTQGITASSFTATGAGLAAAQLRLNPAANLVISSETSAALGAGVRVSTNIYIVGFSSAAAYFGSASGMTGLPSVTAALNMGGNSILNAAAGTFTQSITASSYTATGIGLAAAQLRLNPAANLV
ncbi:MAG: hypothetical protein Q7R35_15260, partial [Elusimicrobiota bacterium]|nr:hypothetical protein [Elusimicrobiota bacterium]